jgi:hypothetical protein
VANDLLRLSRKGRDRLLKQGALEQRLPPPPPIALCDCQLSGFNPPVSPTEDRIFKKNQRPERTPPTNSGTWRPAARQIRQPCTCSFQIINWLAPWNRVLLQKPYSSSVPRFSWNPKVFTVRTTASHLFLSCAWSIHSTQFHLIYLFLCCSMYLFFCRSVYCFCVNVYCTAAIGWQPNCS